MLGKYTYLAWLLGCASPILAAQWAFFFVRLRDRATAIFGAAAVVAMFLGVADGFAIDARVWEFSPALTLGVRLGPVPIEELLFFFLTALLVTQTMALFTSPFAPRVPERPRCVPE